MKLQSYFLLIFLFFVSTIVYAGGEYWAVKVEDKISNNQPQELKLELSETPRGILQGCKRVTVQIEYQRVPVWSWLPFIGSSHPSKKETIEAVEYLNYKFSKSAQTYFGYIGGGLSKALSPECAFKSKGLKLMKIDKDNEFAVLSYYDPV
ncbi:hypothetical protein [Methylomonas koyamae]|uniref:hypothetical protein n=1 Tax=Methylomonas koyamae TaxID=702114 RepID=UPI002872EE0D|nr:hypothetical protein [Methylomonas koyamae]WNB75576.1 hypothetical protein RI210_20205 [Methylomonas koyamae]